MSKSLNEELIHAIKIADITKVIRTIDAGADFDFFDKNGFSPIYYATILLDFESIREAKEKRFDIFKILVDKGCELNPEDTETPLMLACKKGNINAAIYLIENGADIDYVPQIFTTSTALSTSCESGDFDLVEYLLSKGAKIPNDILGEEIYEAAHASKNVHIINLVSLYQESGINLPADNSVSLRAAFGACSIDSLVDGHPETQESPDQIFLAGSDS